MSRDGSLPPGVTGNEPQIAGYPEYDTVRDCDSEGFTVRTISRYGRGMIEKAIDVFGDTRARSDGDRIILAKQYLRAALSEIIDTDVDTECPFHGDVTVYVDMGETRWECPICREDKSEEMD